MTSFLRDITVNTVAEAAEEIRDILVSELWEVDTGSPSSFPMVLKSPNIISGIRPWLRYTNPSGTILRLNGDFDGTGANLSANRDWTLGAGSRLWLATDEKSTCQYIKPLTANGDAYHAGALDRILPADATAIQVGLLSSINSANVAQDAEVFGGTGKWQGSTSGHGLYANIFSGSAVSSTTLLLSTTSFPFIAPYFRFHLANFRGVVPFAVCGLSGAPAGTEYQERDPITDVLIKAYICSGVGAFLVYEA